MTTLVSSNRATFHERLTANIMHMPSSTTRYCTGMRATLRRFLMRTLTGTFGFRTSDEQQPLFNIERASFRSRISELIITVWFSQHASSNQPPLTVCASPTHPHTHSGATCQHGLPAQNALSLNAPHAPSNRQTNETLVPYKHVQRNSTYVST